MNIFFISLIPSLLYSLTNLIDKNLLSKYFKEGGAGTLILVSSLLAGVASIIFFLIEPDVLVVTKTEILILSVAALLDTALLWFYFAALEKEQPSVVIAYYQLVPVIGLVLGYILLNEVIAGDKLVAAAIILAGTSIITFQVSGEGKIQFRTRTTLLMVSACTCWALGNVLFKYVAIEEDLWRSLFWKHVAFGVIGLTLLTFIQSYRSQFFSAMRKNSAAILSLNAFNETVYILGSIISSYAIIYTQVALVQLATTYQHFFVLGISLLVTLTATLPVVGKYAKGIVVDKISRQHVVQSLLALSITAVGTYMLVTAS